MADPILDWRDLPVEEVEAHFNPRVAVADAAERLEAWQVRSEALAAQHTFRRDVRYGDGEKMTYDVHVAPGAGPTVIFIHGGYWRKLDKSDHVFVAVGLQQSGLNVVNVNYDLCPGLTLTELNAELTAAVDHVFNNAGDLGLGEGPFFVMGHSAGGHAAAMVAAQPALAARLEAIIPVSGVFDTRAVLKTTINEDVRLSEEEAARLNVLEMTPAKGLRVHCSVGGDEPPAWIGQTASYHKLASGVSDDCRLEVVPGTNHFSVLEALCDPDHPAGAGLVDFLFGR